MVIIYTNWHHIWVKKWAEGIMQSTCNNCVQAALDSWYQLVCSNHMRLVSKIRE